MVLVSVPYVNRVLRLLPVLVVVILCIRWWTQTPDEIPELTNSELLDRYIQQGTTKGGRWYIPPSWLNEIPYTERILRRRQAPSSPVAAAELALELAIRGSHYIENTNIPLIVHQTWKDFESDDWSSILRTCANSWLEASALEPGREMAYFLWDDEGMDEMMTSYELDFVAAYNKMPFFVEKTDAFRVALTKWFGGVYADIDTMMLLHPTFWAPSRDLKDWQPAGTGQSYSVKEPFQRSFRAPEDAKQSYRELLSKYTRSTEVPVSAIVGIEADNPPDTDTYWRMGYFFPVQLTNWAFAMAPQQPLAITYMNRLQQHIEQNATNLAAINPLLLTGPPAFTKVVKEYAEEVSPGFKFKLLGGLEDPPGGRGKVIAGDVLVLPITGFSPGRGPIGNMGSQALDHPNARLFHKSTGSWKHFDIMSILGKLCRRYLGLCRSWSNIPILEQQ